MPALIFCTRAELSEANSTGVTASPRHMVGAGGLREFFFKFFYTKSSLKLAWGDRTIIELYLWEVVRVETARYVSTSSQPSERSCYLQRKGSVRMMLTKLSISRGS
jgi:hypothetical protein